MADFVTNVTTTPVCLQLNHTMQPANAAMYYTHASVRYEPLAPIRCCSICSVNAIPRSPCIASCANSATYLPCSSSTQLEHSTIHVSGHAVTPWPTLEPHHIPHLLCVICLPQRPLHRSIEFLIISSPEGHDPSACTYMYSTMLPILVWESSQLLATNSNYVSVMFQGM